MKDRLRISPKHARTVLVLINPKAGRKDPREKADPFAERLDRLGFETQVVSDLAELDQLVQQARTEECLRAVVGIGGDGTASLLAGRYKPCVPISILPSGTENLLAKYLMLDSDVEKAAEIIAQGYRLKMDAGKANGKVFLVMASCGFDADVVNRLHRKRKGNIRHLSYAEPILGALGNYRYPKLSIHVGNEKPMTAKWAFVFNVPRYAMQLPIVEDANPTDGMLDLCTFRAGNILNGMRYLVGILMRQHRKWQDTQVMQVKKLRIESTSQDVAFQIDGDPGGFLPVEIEVLPEFLDIFVPQSWLMETGIEPSKEEISVG